MKLSKLLHEFLESEKAGGLLLIGCAVISLFLANSGLQESYLGFWNFEFARHPLVYWVNDGLMAIFFLLIGLELEREIYTGELAVLKNALFPLVGALGGMLVPAGIFLLFNVGTNRQSGAGIPIATDIAFALGVLGLLGNRAPATLKIFLTALAVIDDLGAIVTIAIFYSKGISFFHLGIALAIFIFLLILNRLKIHNLIPYLIGGILMWFFMLHSGVHASIAGVLLAFAVPFNRGTEQSPSYVLQHFLNKPVSLFILPLFAIANTCIVIPSHWISNVTSATSLGIFTGLVIGKPLGILLFTGLAVFMGWCQLPTGLKWNHIIGAGILGGIGFTMSIFIALLAFDKPSDIAAIKITIMLSSLTAAITGLIWLRFKLKTSYLSSAN